jgi:putative flavoprotein involved in K+ transport
MGFPLAHDDAGTLVPGLFFCGVHFLRKRKSSTLFGVGEDAAIVAQSIARNRPTEATEPCRNLSSSSSPSATRSGAR